MTCAACGGDVSGLSAIISARASPERPLLDMATLGAPSSRGLGMSWVPLAFPSPFFFGWAQCAQRLSMQRGPCWKRVRIPSRARQPLDAKPPVEPIPGVLFIPHAYQTLHKRMATLGYLRMFFLSNHLPQPKDANCLLGRMSNALICFRAERSAV